MLSGGDDDPSVEEVSAGQIQVKLLSPGKSSFEGKLRRRRFLDVSNS
jgi:hypothetical protein